jgi:hypothetical protein
VAHLESFSKMRERINFFHQYLAWASALCWQQRCPGFVLGTNNLINYCIWNYLLVAVNDVTNADICSKSSSATATFTKSNDKRRLLSLWLKVWHESWFLRWTKCFVKQKMKKIHLHRLCHFQNVYLNNMNTCGWTKILQSEILLQC